MSWCTVGRGGGGGVGVSLGEQSKPISRFWGRERNYSFWSWISKDNKLLENTFSKWVLGTGSNYNDRISLTKESNVFVVPARNARSCSCLVTRDRWKYFCQFTAGTLLQMAPQWTDLEKQMRSTCNDIWENTSHYSYSSFHRLTIRQCFPSKMLPSGLCAELCCNGGEKGLSGRIGTFSGPILEQIGTFIVICTKMQNCLK